MKNVKYKIKKQKLAIFIIVGVLFFSHAAQALEPTLIILSPAPGEVVPSTTVNVIIDTDVGMASSVTAPGYFLELWLDGSPEDPSRAIATVQRGYIFEHVKPGLHTLHVAVADRSEAGVINVLTQSSVDFEVAPFKDAIVPAVSGISWYSLARDALIFSFPIVGLAFLFLWMLFLIQRKRK